MAKKLYRSPDNKKLAGVCGGIAEYTNIDVTIIRILWVVISIFIFGPGAIIAGPFLYFICAFIIPMRHEGDIPKEKKQPEKQETNDIINSDKIVDIEEFVEVKEDSTPQNEKKDDTGKQ